MELFAADGHDASGCERVTGKSGMRPPRVSPDGARVATRIDGRNNIDIWVSELERNTLARVTTDPATDGSAIWTVDGDEIVFASEQQEGV